MRLQLGGKWWLLLSFFKPYINVVSFGVVPGRIFEAAFNNVVFLEMWWSLRKFWNVDESIVSDTKLLRAVPVIKQNVVTQVVVGAVNTGTAANAAGATAPYSAGACTAVPPDPPGSATAAAAAQTDPYSCSYCCNCSRRPQPHCCCNTFCTHGQDPGTETEIKQDSFGLTWRTDKMEGSV